MPKLRGSVGKHRKHSPKPLVRALLRLPPPKTAANLPLMDSSRAVLHSGAARYTAEKYSANTFPTCAAHRLNKNETNSPVCAIKCAGEGRVFFRRRRFERKDHFASILAGRKNSNGNARTQLQRHNEERPQRADTFFPPAGPCWNCSTLAHRSAAVRLTMPFAKSAPSLPQATHSRESAMGSQRACIPRALTG
ncbi:hypothetical protein TRVL_07645 [Trypanosoma vivax]|nr:hypothetical protein TRVL_07645 [Trypanosoma vivax]